MELLSSGSALADRQIGADEEAGTSPGDRRFRPDVEGLRAVAVVLVVLYHAQVPGLSGGYVGVDVFFVISGFVITGVLLRERDETGGSSLLNFYARRLRRILPAATLVILATVAASYLLLGYVSGDSVANDGRWAAVFLSNLHFAKAGTNYLTSMLPPSPLQNYWSLSVEEQFYIVFPTLFLLATRLRRFATPSAPTRFVPHRCRGGFLWPVNRANGVQSYCGLLFAIHPRVGTGHRGSCGGRLTWPEEWQSVAGNRIRLGRNGGCDLLSLSLQRTDCLSGIDRRHSGGRNGTRNRQWNPGTALGTRVDLEESDLPMVGTAFLLLLSLALADTGHRRRVRG